MRVVESKTFDIISFARRALWNLQASVTIEEESELYRGRGARVVLSQDTRFGVSLDPFGITVSSQPGILINVNLAPDVRIHQLRYTFANGAFHVEAAGDRMNLFGLVGSITASKIEFRLHELFGPMLPAAMREPGYAPSQDEDLVDHLDDLISILTNASQKTREEGRLHSVSPKFAKDLHLYLHIVTPERVSAPLLDAGIELFCPLGTSVFLSVQTDGPLSNSRVRSLKISSSPPGIVIRAEYPGVDQSLNLDLHEVHIQDGRRFSFDYELTSKDLKELPPAVERYLGLENVHFRLAGRSKMLASVRKALDNALQNDAPEYLERMLTDVSPLLPGVDLPTLFGFPASPPPSSKG